MYRFFIGEDAWILRFSARLQVENVQKERVLRSVLSCKKNILLYSHGDSFMIIDKIFGAAVFDVMKLPSRLLTVSSIVPRENWYVFNDYRS